MKGDVIILKEKYLDLAIAVADRLVKPIEAAEGRFVLVIGGESGSGKSVLAAALEQVLESRGIQTIVLQQDDYFVHPPRTNDAARRADINWVGLQEVRLDLLDSHLKAALEGAGAFVKPLVIYGEDRITEETIDLTGIRVVIAEGTYVLSLKHVTYRISLARTYQETRDARRKRGREPVDPFIEDVLAIEHEIITSYAGLADMTISRDYQIKD